MNKEAPENPVNISKRNLAEYEGVIDVDESLVASLVRVCEDVKVPVKKLTGYDR